MVECGFDHETLCNMSEEEFGFYLDLRIELDQIREEKAKEASKGK